MEPASIAGLGRCTIHGPPNDRRHAENPPVVPRALPIRNTIVPFNSDVNITRFESAERTGVANDWHRSYFCPTCGVIWAQWLLESRDLFSPVTRSCKKHRYYDSERPGSLITERMDIRVMPGELLVREFFLGDDMQVDYLDKSPGEA